MTLKLNYCNAFLGDPSTGSTNKLQMVPNAAICPILSYHPQTVAKPMPALQ